MNNLSSEQMPSESCTVNEGVGNLQNYYDDSTSALYEENWKVEKILDVIEKNGNRFYKVKWTWVIWQSEASIQSLHHLLQEFYQENTQGHCAFSNKIEPSEENANDNENMFTNEAISNPDSTVENIMYSNSSAMDHNPNIFVTGNSCDALDNSDENASFTTNDHVRSLHAGSKSKELLPQTVLNEVKEMFSYQRNEANKFLIAPEVVTSQNFLRAGHILCNSQPSTTTMHADSFDEPTNTEKNMVVLGSISSAHNKEIIGEATSRSGSMLNSFEQNPTTTTTTTSNTNTITATAVAAANEFYIKEFVSEKKFLCETCGRSFDRKTSLLRHNFVHTGEKPWHCQFCMKSFNQNAILQRHLLTHSNQKIFHCDQCDKPFSEKVALKRHQATHSAEKQWNCKECGKSFILKEYLAKHRFLHTGVKPHECKVCGRAFADSCALRRHKIVHEKEKFF